jgi:hypothetical protein
VLGGAMWTWSVSDNLNITIMDTIFQSNVIAAGNAIAAKDWPIWSSFTPLFSVPNLYGIINDNDFDVPFALLFLVNFDDATIVCMYVCMYVMVQGGALHVQTTRRLGVAPLWNESRPDDIIGITIRGSSFIANRLMLNTEGRSSQVEEPIHGSLPLSHSN